MDNGIDAQVLGIACAIRIFAFSAVKSALIRVHPWLNSHTVIFPNYFTSTTRQAGAPVLGLFEFFQAVELADFFQAFVNQLPGARTVGTDFASVLPRTAAWAV